MIAEESGGTGVAPMNIRLYNERSPTEFVQLTMSLPPEPMVAIGQGTFKVWQVPANPDDPSAHWASIQVTNGMGLPNVSVQGVYRVKPIDAGSASGLPGFVPRVWTVTTSNATQESVTTQFNWSLLGAEEVPANDPNNPGTTKIVDAAISVVDVITHPNGLVERFRYGNGAANLASKAFSTYGSWQGYKIALPSNDSATDEVPNPSGDPSGGVSSILTEDGGSGKRVLIFHQTPRITKGPGTPSYSWSRSDHVTWVLQYPTASPGTSEAFRGVRIVHPSATHASDPMSASAFLFATAAVLSTERIHGTGIPGELASPGDWTAASLTKVVDQVSIMDGWDLRSWANPAGSLAGALPVTAVATRTTIYTDKLPTKITVAGGTRDAWGPIRTDDFTLPNQPLPASSDGTKVGVWSTSLGSQSGTIQRTGVIARHWDTVALELVTDADEKTLTGTGLPALRFNAKTMAGKNLATLQGVAAVSFGQSAYSHQTGTAFLTQTAGTRDGMVATEFRDYVSGKPLLQSVSTSLTKGSALPYSGAMGTTYGYDSTPSPVARFSNRQAHGPEDNLPIRSAPGPRAAQDRSQWCSNADRLRRLGAGPESHPQSQGHRRSGGNLLHLRSCGPMEDRNGDGRRSHPDHPYHAGQARPCDSCVVSRWQYPGYGL